MNEKNLKRAIAVSLGVHLAAFAMFFFKGCSQTSVISIPQVYQVQLVAMPEVQPAPPDEVVEEIDVETIPPPPEEKKRLKPKPKKEPPKPKKQAAPEKVTPAKSAPEQAVSGPRSDELFEYPYYLRLMVDKISRNWINPYSGQAESVVATVYFRIDRGGLLSDIRVKKSSGVPSFDRAALRAVISSNPLPPLPPDYREPQLTVHLDFEYNPL